jgi:hypothetical protein
MGRRGTWRDSGRLAAGFGRLAGGVILQISRNKANKLFINCCLQNLRSQFGGGARQRRDHRPASNLEVAYAAFVVIRHAGETGNGVHHLAGTRFQAVDGSNHLGGAAFILFGDDR